MDAVINNGVVERIIASEHKNSSIRIINWKIEGDNVAKSSPKYSSVAVRLIVDYSKEGVESRQVFFVKVASMAHTYKFAKHYRFYEREVIAYTDILPEMSAIDEEHFSPKYYYSDDKDSMFLEDLTQSGYKCINCSEQLDFQHCYHVFMKIAKFHALSVKLNNKVGIPELLKAKEFDHSNNDFLSVAISEFINHLPKHVLETYAEEVTALKDGKLNPPDSTRQNDTCTFKVLNHGDLSANNIMFKYDKYGNVVDLKLLDFQMIFWSSPASDLIYFTITSMKFDVYEKYFPLLLEIYLDTLNKTLVSLNFPIYQMQHLLEDVDRGFAHAHSTIYFGLPFVFSDPDDPVDTSGFLKDGEWNIRPLFKVYKQPLYMNHAVKWFVHLLQRRKLSEGCE